MTLSKSKASEAVIAAANSASVAKVAPRSTPVAPAAGFVNSIVVPVMVRSESSLVALKSPSALLCVAMAAVFVAIAVSASISF